MSIPYEKGVAEDLNLGHGTVSVTMPGGGTATGNKIGLHTFNFYFNASDFGAVGDGVNDDTAALQAAYAAAKAAQCPLYIPPGDFVFTSQLLWDGYVCVYGAGRGQAPATGTTLRKKGTFTGIYIGNPNYPSEAGGDFMEYRDFVVNAHASGAGGVGIEIQTVSNGSVLRNIQVYSQGSHGILVSFASGSRFENIHCATNGGDGIRLEPAGTDYCNANVFDGIYVAGNTGYGLNIVGGAAGSYANQCFNVVAQNNTNYGVRVNDITNVVFAYCETNTAGDVLLDTSAERNFVVITNNSGGLGGVDDLGTNNWILDISNGLFRAPVGLGPIARATNIAGSAFAIVAGAAGAGATGAQGGALSLDGGAAAGTAGAANGGSVDVSGGAGVNGGTYGPLRLQRSGGQVLVGASAASSVGSLVELHSTTQAFCLTQVTTAERDLIASPRNGMLVYNSTTGAINAYAGGAWVAL